ncbi:hypothetical protein HDU77_005988 [Chytriomyces hyalinus]|nr:hypothetical protein HDU77_005988 [Chytriomyces hyalinus]
MPQEAPVVKVMTRKEDIAGFLSGSKPLSSSFTNWYKLGCVLGEGGLTGGTVLPEISILQQLDHPNIIKYIDHVVEPTKYMLLIMGLHGSNWKCTSTSSTTLWGDDALAINNLQVKGLIHRDIMDENIVVDSSYNVKMIDFGSAANILKTQPQYFTHFCGTIPYTSPEIVQKESYRGPEVEVWALGVLLYTMVVGGSPFHSDAEILEGTVMMPRGFHLESDKDYHGGCRHLIQRLLDCDPETRITIEEVLEHSWLKKEVEFYQTAYPSTSA